MSRRSLNAEELIEIMNKLWASTEDIQKIGCIGERKALQIKREIRDKMVDDGLTFPRYLVSMEYVIDYFNIDEKRIRRMIVGGVANAG